MGFDVFARRLRIVNNSALQQWFHIGTESAIFMGRIQNRNKHRAASCGSFLFQVMLERFDDGRHRIGQSQTREGFPSAMNRGSGCLQPETSRKEPDGVSPAEVSSWKLATGCQFHCQRRGGSDVLVSGASIILE